MSPLQLHTPRLALRPPAASDIGAIHALHALPETDRYNTLGIPFHADETTRIVKGWIKENRKKKRTHYFFVIESQADHSFIGVCALVLGKAKYRRGEVWYKLLPAAWNQGYATEAVNALIRFAFDELELHRLEAGCAVDNVASARVLEKAGMSLEGRKKLALPLKSGWSDCFEYGLITPFEKNTPAHAAH